MKELANQQAVGLQVFYNESENVSIRTKVIAGEPWFVGKDVCNLLGIANTKDALSRLDDDERRGVGITDPIGRNQQVNHLIFISRKPEAKTIRRWVTGTVLPSIRRTGSYTVGQEEQKRLPLPRLRPYFKQWKESLTPYVSCKELGKTAVAEMVTLEHVMKVWAGTSVSRRVAERITAIAMQNRKDGIIYPEEKPLYEQLCIEWEG